MRNLGILFSASLVAFALSCGSGGGSGTPAVPNGSATCIAGVTNGFVPASMTVKKGSSTCFSTVFDGNAVYSGAGGSVTIKDGSGKTVATARYDDAISYYLITCTGAQEVATDPSCLDVWPTSILTTSKCEEGGCTP